MKQHKWHKEIKAWADGAEIEMWYGDRWEQVYHAPNWFEHEEFRIKPQPIQTFKAPTDPTSIKEPQYLYAWLCEGQVIFTRFDNLDPRLNGHYESLGKIKLEDDDGNTRIKSKEAS